MTSQKTDSNVHEYMKAGFMNSHVSHINYLTLDKESWLKTKYQEHTRYIKQNDPQPACSLNILDSNQENVLFTTTINFRTNIFQSNQNVIIKNSYRNKMQVKKASNVTTDLWSSKYITPETQYLSILRLPTYFLDFSTQLTLLTTRPLPPLPRTINIVLSFNTCI
jgi:hypothetical protein